MESYTIYRQRIAPCHSYVYDNIICKSEKGTVTETTEGAYAKISDTPERPFLVAIVEESSEDRVEEGALIALTRVAFMTAKIDGAGGPEASHAVASLPRGKGTYT